MTHRGAVAADGKTGDGCGLLMKKPDVFLRKVAADLGFDLGDGDYCAGNLFFSQDDKRRDRARAVLNESLTLQGLNVAVFRIVPSEMSAPCDAALERLPVGERVLVTGSGDTPPLQLKVQPFKGRRHRET